MTADQSGILRKKRNEIVLKAFLMTFILGIVTLWLVLQAEASGQGVFYLLALGIFSLTVFVGMDVVDVLLAIQQDLALNRIALAQGQMSVPSTFLHDVLTGQHTIFVNEKEYRVLHKTPALNAEYCHVVYAPCSRIVLSLEA
ncbi:MAG: hypothetical protein RLP44_24480 [Aggregatilineales bacterium]